jgi:hypothetical protein
MSVTGAGTFIVFAGGFGFRPAFSFEESAPVAGASEGAAAGGWARTPGATASAGPAAGGDAFAGAGLGSAWAVAAVRAACAAFFAGVLGSAGRSATGRGGVAGAGRTDGFGDGFRDGFGDDFGAGAGFARGAGFAPCFAAGAAFRGEVFNERFS